MQNTGTRNDILFCAPKMDIRSLRNNTATFNIKVFPGIPCLEHGFTHASEAKSLTC